MTMELPFKKFLELLESVEQAIPFYQEALVNHDAALGRTTTKNRLQAEEYEQLIKKSIALRDYLYELDKR